MVVFQLQVFGSQKVSCKDSLEKFTVTLNMFQSEKDSDYRDSDQRERQLALKSGEYLNFGLNTEEGFPYLETENYISRCVKIWPFISIS